MAEITFEKELESLLNRYSKENDSNTPDFILTEYLTDCLVAYNKALKNRDKWFNINPWTKEKEELSASEALFGFCGWLTGRKAKTTMSSKDNCALIPDLIKLFCDTNKLTEPRDNWHKSLTQPDN